MLVRSAITIIGLALAGAALAQDKNTPLLESTLKVKFAEGKTLGPMGGKAPLELHFLNQAKQEQKFANTELHVALLDQNGEQVKNAIAVTTELRDISLKGPATIDRPGVSIVAGKLKSGEEYFLVVAVRNLIGHVKFKAQ